MSSAIQKLDATMLCSSTKPSNNILLQLSYRTKTLTESYDRRMEYAGVRRHPLLNACLSQKKSLLCFKYDRFSLSHNSSDPKPVLNLAGYTVKDTRKYDLA